MQSKSVCGLYNLYISFAMIRIAQLQVSPSTWAHALVVFLLHKPFILLLDVICMAGSDRNFFFFRYIVRNKLIDNSTGNLQLLLRRPGNTANVTTAGGFGDFPQSFSCFYLRFACAVNLNILRWNRRRAYACVGSGHFGSGFLLFTSLCVW